MVNAFLVNLIDNLFDATNEKGATKEKYWEPVWLIQVLTFNYLKRQQRYSALDIFKVKERLTLRLHKKAVQHQCHLPHLDRPTWSRFTYLDTKTFKTHFNKGARAYFEGNSNITCRKYTGGGEVYIISSVFSKCLYIILVVSFEDFWKIMLSSVFVARRLNLSCVYIQIIIILLIWIFNIIPKE